ncbi:MAG: hypothetical protein K1X36_06735 [Pyrinomonadaceae bacterium]|nr:hypothetical protein [Pyrinomonadaceae bacterium]
MREFVIILIVILILLGLTAYKYRRQIAMIIGFGKMLRDARADIRRSASPRRIDHEPSELVCCTRCGTWVPQDRAIRFDAKTYYCSQDCVRSAMTAA